MRGRLPSHPETAGLLASAICVPKRMTLSGGRPSEGMSALSGFPSTCSITMKAWPSCSPTSLDGADVWVVQGRGAAGFLEEAS